MAIFETDGKEYELKYNLKRVGMIENVTEMPTMAELQKHRGMLSIQHLMVYFGYAVKEADSDAFLPPKKGMEMAESLIESQGYNTVCGWVLEAIQRDCPFFFPAD